MDALNEVSTTVTSKTRHHAIQFETKSGKRVMVCHSENLKSWTVYFNPTRPRSVGKTFWSPDEMIAHYKRIRAELTIAMQQINNASL